MHPGDLCVMLLLITTVTSMSAFSGLGCSDRSKGMPSKEGLAYKTVSKQVAHLPLGLTNG